MLRGSKSPPHIPPTSHTHTPITKQQFSKPDAACGKTHYNKLVAKQRTDVNIISQLIKGRS